MSAKSKIIKMATGSTSAVNTKAGPKPLSMSAYRSMTSKERATTKLNARRANNMGEITDKEYDTIVDRVDAANKAESQSMTTKMQQGKADKNAPPVTLKKELPPARGSNNPPVEKNPRDMTKAELLEEIKKQEAKAKTKMKKGGMAKKKKGAMYKDGGMPMVMKNGKKVPAFAADGVGKMMKGGMAKKKKAKSNYAYGGMTTSKPRTGNTDYRMGGMFMKNGKK